jgi:putative transcriptional regulator
MKNRLRVLRAEREWSQADLASRLGVSRQTVNAIETGKYDPSLPLAFDMAELFNLRIEEIFRPDEKRPEEEAGKQEIGSAGGLAAGDR